MPPERTTVFESWKLRLWAKSFERESSTSIRKRKITLVQGPSIWQRLYGDKYSQSSCREAPADTCNARAPANQASWPALTLTTTVVSAGAPRFMMIRTRSRVCGAWSLRLEKQISSSSSCLHSAPECRSRSSCSEEVNNRFFAAARFDDSALVRSRAPRSRTPPVQVPRLLKALRARACQVPRHRNHIARWVGLPFVSKSSVLR